MWKSCVGEVYYRRYVNLLWHCCQGIVEESTLHTGPGDFNKACSTLFSGYFYDLHIEGNRCEDGNMHVLAGLLVSYISIELMIERIVSHSTPFA